MKPRYLLSCGLIAALPAGAARAAVYPYSEYHLGEAGSLTGAGKLPQDSSGQNHHLFSTMGGDKATVSNSTAAAALGSTASLNTSAAGNQGWSGYLAQSSHASLQKNNFAFGIFAQAPSTPTTGSYHVFSLGSGALSYVIELRSNGWAARTKQEGYPFATSNVVPFTPNTWVHLAIIRTDNVSRFYINGVAQGGSTSQAPQFDSPVLAGANDTMGADLNGLLDEARVVTFTQGETTANIIAALQAGAVPTAFVSVGSSATCAKALLSPTEASVFRIGGAVQDFIRVLNPDGLEVGGTAPQKHQIQIQKEGPIPAGRYPLIGYTGALAGQGLAGLELVPIPGPYSSQTLEINAATSTIDLVLGGSGGITWSGASSDIWNVEGAANWVEDGTSIASAFSNGDDVTLDDSAPAGARNLLLTETVLPGYFSIRGSGNYTLRGAGIGGATVLRKYGTGTLTLLNANTGSGPVTINAGTLSVGDGGAEGNLGSGDITLNGGTLQVNRSGDLLLPNHIAGTGGIQKLGPGRLILGTPDSNPNQIIYINNFTGPVTISAGEIVSAGESCLGETTGGTTIEAGAAFDIAGIGAGYESFTVKGDGPDGAGAIKNTGAAAPYALKGKLILAGDASIGGSSDWGMGDDHWGWLFDMSGDFKLTKRGSNRISLGTSSVSVKDIALESGTLEVWSSTAVGASSSGPGKIMVNGGTLLFALTSNNTSFTKPIELNGGMLKASNPSGSTSWYGFPAPIRINSNAPIWVDSLMNLMLKGVVSGSGELVKDGPGSLWLDMPPAHTGNTTIKAGQLYLRFPGLNDATTLTVADGGAQLALAFDGTERVDKLYLGNVRQPAGFYSYQTHPAYFAYVNSSSTSFVPYKGYIHNMDGATGTNYEIWASSNGISGADPEADSDQDGINNALEFAIGGNPATNSGALLPVLLDKAINGDSYVKDFVFRRNYMAKGMVTAEYTSNLNSNSWTTATELIDYPAYYGPGSDRVIARINITGKKKFFVRLRVTLP